MGSYGWMPCFACGSRDHCLDDCPNAAEYWAALEEELREPVEGGEQDRQNPAQQA